MPWQIVSLVSKVVMARAFSLVGFADLESCLPFK